MAWSQLIWLPKSDGKLPGPVKIYLQTPPSSGSHNFCERRRITLSQGGEKQYDVTILALPTFKTFCRSLFENIYRFRVTRKSHDESKDTWDNKLCINSCLIYANARVANNGLHNSNFIRDPSSYTTKRYVAVLHYQNPQLPHWTFPTVPWATTTSSREATQPHYCKAYNRALVYIR